MNSEDPQPPISARKRNSLSQFSRLGMAVIILGPMLIGVLTFIDGRSGHVINKNLPSFTAAIGALWGLSGGLAKKSLLRSIVGLNAGALLGFACGSCCWFYVPQWDFPALWRKPAIECLLFSGFILGCLLNVSRIKWAGLYGGLAGAGSFGAMALLQWTVTKLFIPDWSGWILMCLLPFGASLIIFIGFLSLETKDPRKDPL